MCMPVRAVCKPHSPDLKKRCARGCNLWRSLLERPPPALESWVRNPLGTRTSWDGADPCRGVLHIQGTCCSITPLAQNPMKQNWFVDGFGALFITFSFTRHFYPKRLTVHSGYTTFSSVCVSWEFNPQPFALLTQCSTTEPQEHFSDGQIRSPAKHQLSQAGRPA